MKKIAFLFPGQGSQKLGMLSDLIQKEPIVANTFKEASDYLKLDMLALTQSGTVDDLNLTQNAQPALLTASVALWRLWQEKTHERPFAMMGHSLGEYSALVCSEVISFKEAVTLVFRRGQYMQAAVPINSGMMAAILKLEDEQVIDLCLKVQASLQQVVAPANFNSPGQIVISGTTQAVEQVMKQCLTLGGIAKKIPVTVPSHCLLMKEAANQLKNDMECIVFNKPSYNLIQNISADLEDDPQQIKENLIAQLYSPVRWVDSVRLLFSLGVDYACECGPNQILAGLNKRIEPSYLVKRMDSIQFFQDALLMKSV